MPRHTKLGFLPSLESIKEEWGKYLTLKILATKVLGLFNRFHSCFAIVVMLKNFESLKIQALLPPWGYAIFS
jgi:hypothetical protein